MSETKTVKIPFIPWLDKMEVPDDIRQMLDDQGVMKPINEVNWAQEFPYRPLAAFSIAHSGTALYVDFLVRCNYLRAENYTDQSPVSQDSCVEFFVSPTSDLHYWNFEFNCIGAINASHRSERNKPTRLTSDELARVRRYPSCGSRPFCELEGLFIWSLLVVIPFDLIGVEYDGTPKVISGNFNKCASATSQPHYLSWNRIVSEKPDFHRPDCFGHLILL